MIFSSRWYLSLCLLHNTHYYVRWIGVLCLHLLLSYQCTTALSMNANLDNTKIVSLPGVIFSCTVKCSLRWYVNFRCSQLMSRSGCSHTAICSYIQLTFGKMSWWQHLNIYFRFSHYLLVFASVKCFILSNRKKKMSVFSLDAVSKEGVSSAHFLANSQRNEVFFRNKKWAPVFLISKL